MYFNKNISLIGFMGSGKTTIGKLLSEELSFLFVDTDSIIEYLTGFSVKKIFEKYNEDYFRKIESEVVQNIYLNENCVFSCGGGIFTLQNNIKIIRKNSFTVYLSISEEEAYERLKNVKDRPLLLVKGDLKQKIKKMMNQRKSIYENNCDLKIDADGKSPERIKNEILSFLSLN